MVAQPPKDKTQSSLLYLVFPHAHLIWSAPPFLFGLLILLGQSWGKVSFVQKLLSVIPENRGKKGISVFSLLYLCQSSKKYSHYSHGHAEFQNFPSPTFLTTLAPSSFLLPKLKERKLPSSPALVRSAQPQPKPLIEFQKMQICHIHNIHPKHH